MRVLLGTTNPSKVKRFSDLLKGYDIEFITLRDIEVIEEPKEMGNTPEETGIYVVSDVYSENDWKLGWEGNDIKRAVGAVIDMIIESIRSVSYTHLTLPTTPYV